MHTAPGDDLPIEGRALAGWNVMPGGTEIAIGLTTRGGSTRRIVLAFDALTGLLMTLPRMLQSALDARFPDGSLRVVQNLGTWTLEQPEAADRMILRLGTPDGFEVAFALDTDHACSLGAALLQAPHEIPRTKMRRPN